MSYFYNNQPPYAYGYNPNPLQPSNGNGINWVQGEAGVKAFYVRPGDKAILFDSERDVFYIKAADMSGMPLPLRSFSYQEIFDNTPKNVPQVTQESNQFVTKDEFQIFEKRIAEIEELLK